MNQNNISQEDIDFIEKFYSDFEVGYNSIGKKYTRPSNYIERALKVLYGNSRKPLSNQTEGKKGAINEII